MQVNLEARECVESGFMIYAWHLAFQIKLYYHDDAKIKKNFLFLISGYLTTFSTEQKPFEKKSFKTHL